MTFDSCLFCKTLKTVQCSVKMPTYIFDHQTCREKTCLLCLRKAVGKGKRVHELTNRVKELIEVFALPHYRQYCDMASLPNVICHACRMKLERKEKGMNVTLTVPEISKFMDFGMPTGPI